VAKRASESNTVALISLSKAREILGKCYPDEIGIGREKLARGLAAQKVPYSPNHPDLDALWRKLAGQDNQEIQHVRSEGDWAEFYIKGVRRVIGPIRVGREAVLALLPKDARLPPEKPRRVKSKDWIIKEAQRLKRLDEIPADISKTDFAKLLADNMDRAAKADHSISIKPVGWEYIFNHLRKWGLWPISAIQ
jgi:hypothetical protein